MVNWLRMPSYIIMLSISNRVVTYHLPGASKYHCYKKLGVFKFMFSLPDNSFWVFFLKRKEETQT